MSVIWKNKKGKEVTLLNPAEKGRKAAQELKLGYHLTNDGVVKGDKNGNPIPLTDTEKAWRRGVLTARKDSADCYNAKNGKKSKKNKNDGNSKVTVGTKITF